MQKERNLIGHFTFSGTNNGHVYRGYDRVGEWDQNAEQLLISLSSEFTVSGRIAEIRVAKAGGHIRDSEAARSAVARTVKPDLVLTAA